MPTGQIESALAPTGDPISSGCVPAQPVAPTGGNGCLQGEPADRNRET